MGTDTTALLAERATTHGDFSVHALLTQSLKNIAHSDAGGYSSLPDTHREALDMIMHKVGRILAGNPNHKDHWDDIAGYARLVSDRIAPPASDLPPCRRIAIGPGTPEDGGHHAKMADRCEDGLREKPLDYPTLGFETPNGCYYITDRFRLPEKQWDHLPRLRTELTHKEHEETLAEYQPLYRWNESASKYEMHPGYVRDWGKE